MKPEVQASLASLSLRLWKRDWNWTWPLWPADSQLSYCYWGMGVLPWTLVEKLVFRQVIYLTGVCQ